MKAFLGSIIFCFVCILFTNTNTICAEVYGPKIFGLQLGMSENEVNDILNTLAKEYNGRIFSDYLISKDNKYSMQVHIKNKKLYGFVIYSSFFDISNLNNKNFIRDFCNHYSIPLDEMYNNSYTNIEDGYKIIINYNDVSIKTIEKSKQYVKPKFK